jgi:hypothetical protein
MFFFVDNAKLANNSFQQGDANMTKMSSWLHQAVRLALAG